MAIEAARVSHQNLLSYLYYILIFTMHVYMFPQPSITPKSKAKLISIKKVI